MSVKAGFTLKCGRAVITYKRLSEEGVIRERFRSEGMRVGNEEICDQVEDVVERLTREGLGTEEQFKLRG